MIGGGAVDAGSRLAGAGEGYDPVAARSASIGADCYVDPAFLEVERAEIFRRSWQFLCHEEKLREPGSYVTARIQDRGVVAVRGEDGALRAFYNVCKHRGHEVLAGAGRSDAADHVPLPRLGLHARRAAPPGPALRVHRELRRLRDLPHLRPEWRCSATSSS